MMKGDSLPSTKVITKTITYVTGLTPFICGKPNSYVLDSISKEYGLTPEDETFKANEDKIPTYIYFTKMQKTDSYLVFSG